MASGRSWWAVFRARPRISRAAAIALLAWVWTTALLFACGPAGPEPLVLYGNVPAGEYSGPVEVFLLTNRQASIRYTLDGTDPVNGRPYAGTITVERDALLRAVATTDGEEAHFEVALRIRPPAPAASTVPGFSLRFEEIFLTESHPGFTDFKFIPGSRELVLAQKDGTIHHYRLDGAGSATHLGSVRLGRLSDSTECGLLSLAFDPGFATNRYLYVGYCPDDWVSRISRVIFDPEAYVDGGVLGETEIITVGDYVSDVPLPQHATGSMGFAADGTMWAMFGDRLAPERALTFAENRSKVIRIIPNRDPAGSGFTPASGNRSPAGPSERPEIYASGFRNPWRASLDSRGRLWVVDVGTSGAGGFEEINVIAAPGGLFGWSVFEGPCNLRFDATACRPFTDPIRSWHQSLDHPFVREDPQATRIGAFVGWVGIEHRDRGNDPYAGKLRGFIPYGDMCQGFVRAISLNDDLSISADGFVGHLPGVAAWDQGPDGYLYVATFGTCEYLTPSSGKLYRVELR